MIRWSFPLIFCIFATVMKTMFSRMMMTLAALMVLLMSSIPHHHHCTLPGGFHHADYVCFASQDEDDAHCALGDCRSSSGLTGDSQSADSGEASAGDENQCGHRPCGDSENCRLHSIVTLLERVRNLPAYQPVLDFVAQEVLAVSAPDADLLDAARIVLSEKLTSFYLIRAKRLRAPPSALSCLA